MTVPISRRSVERLPHRPLSTARLKRTVRLGLRSLWNHRLRSLLTALGIVFGVCSVIAMLAIGEGASYEQQELIRQMGSNNIIIKGVKPPEEKTSTAEQTRVAEYGLTYADVDRIKETIPGVEIKVPGRKVRKDVWHGGNRVHCDIFGTVPWYTEVNNHQVAYGRFFNRIELDAKANVCVLGDGMAGELFPLDSPIGGRVHVGAQYYRVVGVMEPKSSRVADGNSNCGPLETEESGAAVANLMFIPLTTAKERFGESIRETATGSFSFERFELHEVTVKVARLEDVIVVSALTEAVLECHHDRSVYCVYDPVGQLPFAKHRAPL